MIKVTVTNINARSSARQPRTVVVRVPGPQGRAGTNVIGDFVVLNPDQLPDITTSGTIVDQIYNFSLPRAPSFAVGTVTTGAPGSSADVVDVGADGDIVLDLDIPQGDKGDAATVDVGVVTTVNPDQQPDVSNTGTVNDAIFDFELPRAPTFTVGTVTAVAQGLESVADVGADGDIVLDFELPKGDKGDKGDVGELTVGTTSPVNPDQNPSVVNSGTTSDAVFDFSLPRAPTFSVGTVTAVAQGLEAVTNVGTNGDIVLNFDAPKGDTGEQGIQGIQGIQGEQGIQGIQGIQGDFSLAQPIEAKSAAYTFVSSDAGKLLTMTGANNFTVTSGTALSVGQRIDLLRIGTGAVSVVQGSGATLTSTPGLKLRAQWSGATLFCTASNTYGLIGDLAA